MTECKIILVDDHSLFRNGLRGLLDRQEGLSVVGQAASGEEFLELLPSVECDLVFMDISMPGIDGAAATERALLSRPDLKVITLSMFGDQHYYSKMVEAGAKGFMLKDSDVDEVLESIEVVMQGGSYFCKNLLDRLTNSMRTIVREAASEEEQLSTREAEVLVGVCQGLSNVEIADTLFISKRTVDKHRANILEKTGCKNTASLVVYAIKNHLVEL